MSDASAQGQGAAGLPIPQLGSYRLVAPLGSGGMSNVYRAIHIDSGHEVAVKVLPRSLARNATMLQRFLREAKTAETLQDPDIVPIFDRGAEGGRYYIVLEYMPGGDLSDRVRDYGPLPLYDAVSMIRTVARGLMHANEIGLIHRDIKPANLLLDAEGRVKITDLGLALQTLDDDERVTRDGTTVGTVDYMSPEQARDSRSTTLRSDIYSLGCTFYYLLTGEPPFQGGDVPEKLRKHAFDPPPDVREKRPEVPEELAELIKRMMAKRPERRFVDYEHLIDALDELPIAPPGEVLEAIIDDDEPAPRPPKPKASAEWFDDIFNPTPATEDYPRLVDDRPILDVFGEKSTTPPADSGSETYGLAPGPGTFEVGPSALASNGDSPPSTKSSPAIQSHDLNRDRRARQSEPPRDVDISALAGVEETGRTLARPKPPVEVTTEQPSPAIVGAAPPDEVQSPVPATIPIVPASVVAEILATEQAEPESPAITVTRVLQATVLFLLLSLAIVGATQGINWWRNRGNQGAVVTGEPAPEPTDTNDTLRGPVELPGKNSKRPTVAWTEPEPRLVTPPPAPVLDADALAKLDLSGLPTSSIGSAPAPVLEVRRGSGGGNRERLASLRAALDAPTGTVELSDSGPHFEQDLRINGSDRRIRAADGQRAIIVVEEPTLASVKTRPALLVLEKKGQVVLEGIDLVIPASALEASQTAVFVSAGTNLTLRDCTITVDGRIGRPVALFQLGLDAPSIAGGPTRIRLERSLIRCSDLSAFKTVDGDARIELVESMILSENAPSFVFAGPAAAARSLAILNCAIATSGPLIELAGAAASDDANPLSVRAYASTFARVVGNNPGGLVTCREPAGNRAARPGKLDWSGDTNTFAGWTAHSVADDEGNVVAADMQALKSLNPSSDAASAETDGAWPTTVLGWAGASDIAAFDPRLKSLANRVAQPIPHLREWTLGAFERQTTATISTSFKGILNLDFDADTQNSGDLGDFLKERIPSGTTHVRVRATGTGRQWMTPLQLRDGMSLEISVENRHPDTPLVWVIAEKTQAGALLTVQGGDLTLKGVRIERDAGARLRHAIQVSDGRLRMENCWIRAPLQVEDGGGDLIAFRGQGSRPVDDADNGPSCQIADSLFMTGGIAISASLGRGAIVLNNSAISAGRAAFDLHPQGVASERFLVDLSLDHCTIFAERDVVRIAAWPAPYRPDRPWIISTSQCVIMDAFDRGGAPSTTLLLNGDPTALGRGAVLWQSQQDVLGATRFVATSDSNAKASSFPDLTRDWAGFWGPSHVQGAQPARSLIELPRGKVAPTKLKPEDFAIRVVGAPQSTVGANVERVGIATGRPSP